MDENSCRVCIKNIGIVSIYESECNISYLNMITSLASQEIHKEYFERFPTKLCLDCVERINNSINLKKDIDEANKLYLNKIDSLSNFDEEIFDKYIKTEEEDQLSETCEVIVQEQEEEEPVQDDFENKMESVSDTSEKSEESFIKTKKQVKIKSCQECDKQFKTNYTLQQHIIAVHTGEKPYECNECGKKFPYKGTLQAHKKIHAERPFICEICSKQFISTYYLNRHKVVHLPDTEREIFCDKCDKSFRDKRYFRHHMKTHEGIKDVICELCDKRFYRKKDLTKHVNTVHLSIRKHICSVCGKAFANKSNLTAHVRIHTGEKPYKCKYCPSSFNQSTPYVKHTKTHEKRGDIMINLQE